MLYTGASEIDGYLLKDRHILTSFWSAFVSYRIFVREAWKSIFIKALVKQKEIVGALAQNDLNGIQQEHADAQKTNLGIEMHDDVKRRTKYHSLPQSSVKNELDKLKETVENRQDYNAIIHLRSKTQLKKHLDKMLKVRSESFRQLSSCNLIKLSTFRYMATWLL